VWVGLVADESRLLAEETREETLERTEDKREERLLVGRLEVLESEEEAERGQVNGRKNKGESRRTTAEGSLETLGCLNFCRGTVGLEALGNGLLILSVNAHTRGIRAVRGLDRVGFG